MCACFTRTADIAIGWQSYTGVRDEFLVSKEISDITTQQIVWILVFGFVIGTVFEVAFLDWVFAFCEFSWGVVVHGICFTAYVFFENSAEHEEFGELFFSLAL